MVWSTSSSVPQPQRGESVVVDRALAWTVCGYGESGTWRLERTMGCRDICKYSRIMSYCLLPHRSELLPLVLKKFSQRNVLNLCPAADDIRCERVSNFMTLISRCPLTHKDSDLFLTIVLRCSTVYHLVHQLIVGITDDMILYNEQCRSAYRVYV